MKNTAKGLLLLSPLWLVGCLPSAHKNGAFPENSTAPALQQSAPPKPEPSRAELPPSINALPESDLSAGKARPSKPPIRRPRPPAHPPIQAQQQAASGSPAVSAIGQLSSGEPADVRSNTLASIAATERNLKSIRRPLSEQEQKIAAHIREYLKQAQRALNSGDLEGANTLAAKAGVLLKELAP